MKVWPPIVTVPLRCNVLLLAVTLKVTVPLPLPLAPPVTVIHPLLLAAVHEQPEPAATPTVLDPAVEAIERLVGDRLYVQGAPDWVTVNVCPAIVNVPVRDDVLELLATL